MILLLLACSDSSVTKNNASPEATITAPAEGAVVREGDPVTWTGAAGDADDDASELTATWYAGDAVVCPASVPAADGTTSCAWTADPDSPTISLEVRDPSGAAATASRTVSVTPNEAPVATISAPLDGARWYSDQLLVLEGAVTDDTDDPLTVTWSSSTDGDVATSTPDGDGSVREAVYLSEGQHLLTLAATDAAGARGTDAVQIDIRGPNTAPTCNVTAPADGSSVETGATLVLQGTVGDVDEPADGLTVAWTSDRDGALGTPTPSSAGDVALGVTLSAGTHVVTLAVTDEVGTSCTDFVVVAVSTRPTVTILAPGDGDVVNEGDVVALEATVGDTEDPAASLDLTWASDLDGVLDTSPAGSDGNVSASASGLTRGDHVITLDVVDSAGLPSSDLVHLRVNGLPDAPGITLSPGSPTTSDDLVATVSRASTDPEADAVVYRFDWYVDGALWASDVSATLPSDATSRGETWEVVATPYDPYGDGAPARASVTIGNTAPTVDLVTLSPGSPSVGVDVTCAATGSDTDGDALTATYAWSVDGTPVATGATLDGAFVRAGVLVRCDATISDGTNSATGSASATVVDTPPEVTSVTLSPNPVATAGTLTCAATATDADGDTITLRYTWTSAAGSFDDAASVAATRFSPGDTVSCTVTPTAVGVEGSPLTSNVVRVNRPPTVAVSLTPDPAANGDTVSCLATGTDPDGGSPTLTYAWTRDGVAAGTGTSLAATRHGEVLACTVTAADGLDTASATASLTVVNTPPSITSLTLSPSRPATDDTLSAAITTDDRDGDAVTLAYAWDVDGAPAGTGATLSGSTFSKGQVVTLTVTPSDGAATGPAATASVTIANTAPSAPVVSVTPLTSVEGESDLTCVVTTAATDADGDTVAYTFEWTVDGSAWSGATTTTLPGDTVPAAEATAGVWECTATPDDGWDSGASASASAMVESGISTWVDVAVGGYYACAIDTDAQLTCWGSSANMQTVPGGDWTKVDISSSEGCGIHTDGTIECWGSGGYVATPPSGTYTDLEVQNYHACALGTDGTIDCWGDAGGSRDFGQITGGPHTDYIDVGTGTYNSCGVRASGTVECWGRESASEPTSATYLTVTGGLSWNCAMESTGDVDCWGEVNVHEADAPTADVVDLSGGYMHACALLSTGAIDCFGTPQNDYGQQADPSGTNWIDVAAGFWATFAIDTDGQLTGWGRDNSSIISGAP